VAQGVAAQVAVECVAAVGVEAQAVGAECGWAAVCAEEWMAAAAGNATI
jgi:hypothetical protein